MSLRDLITHIIESARGKTKTYTISGNPETLKRLEKLLVACRWMGNGSSRSILFAFDGDGSDWLKCEDLDGVKLSEEEADKLDNGLGILINGSGDVSKITNLPEWEVDEPIYKVKEASVNENVYMSVCKTCGQILRANGSVQIWDKQYDHMLRNHRELGYTLDNQDKFFNRQR